MRAPLTDPPLPLGVPRLDWFPSDASNVQLMLQPKDLALAVGILATFPLDARVVIEIGVYKGWWSMGVLKNDGAATVVGIDPFLGDWGRGVHADLRANLLRNDLAGRFELFAARDDADAVLRPRSVGLIHVDGEHTEAAVQADLTWAERFLRHDGIVVVDDYRNAWWPGVGSAMHSFLREASFRPVLVTERKAYLCRSESHEDWVDRFEEHLSEQSNIPWARHWREGEAVGGPQRPDVLGSRVLLVLGPADVHPRGLLGDPGERFGPLRRSIAPVLEQVLPPILLRALISGAGALRSLRTSLRRGPR